MKRKIVTEIDCGDNMCDGCRFVGKTEYTREFCHAHEVSLPRIEGASTFFINHPRPDLCVERELKNGGKK